MTKYSVAVGNSTDEQYHRTADITCGHKHRSAEAAAKCQKELLDYHKDETGSLVCSAKWYNSWIQQSGEVQS